MERDTSASDVSTPSSSFLSSRTRADFPSLLRLTDWKNPGPFNEYVADDGTTITGAWGQFVSFWSVFVQAAFSFIGESPLATRICLRFLF